MIPFHHPVGKLGKNCTPPRVFLPRRSGGAAGRRVWRVKRVVRRCIVGTSGPDREGGVFRLLVSGSPSTANKVSYNNLVSKSYMETNTAHSKYLIRCVAARIREARQTAGHLSGHTLSPVLEVNRNWKQIQHSISLKCCSMYIQQPIFSNQQSLISLHTHLHSLNP